MKKENRFVIPLYRKHFAGLGSTYSVMYPLELCFASISQNPFERFLKYRLILLLAVS